VCRRVADPELYRSPSWSARRYGHDLGERQAELCEQEVGSGEWFTLNILADCGAAVWERGATDKYIRRAQLQFKH